MDNIVHHIESHIMSDVPLLVIVNGITELKNGRRANLSVLKLNYFLLGPAYNLYSPSTIYLMVLEFINFPYCDRHNKAPKDIHVIIPRTYEYVTLHEKKKKKFQM